MSTGISELADVVEKAESARSVNAQQTIAWTARFIELGRFLGLIDAQGEFSETAAAALAKSIDPAAEALKRVQELPEGS